MEETTKVPAEIAAIIEQKKMVMQAKQKEEERTRLEKRNQMIEAGRSAFRSKVAETLKAVPDWLHQYDVTEIECTEDDLERVGEGYNKLDSLWLEFHIPGLAPIQFQREKIRGAENFVNQWRSANVYFEHHYDYGYSDKPTLAFTNSSSWRTDLEFVFGEAEMNFSEFASKMAEYNQRLEDSRIREEQQEESDVKANVIHAAEQAARESEERILFNLFKDDPVAINLMKAFLMINQERTAFNAQLEDANETVYSIEQRWIRRAEDLRRQAEHAQRMADEERNRVSSLQSDLDDAEGKLKKAQRGW